MSNALTLANPPQAPTGAHRRSPRVAIPLQIVDVHRVANELTRTEGHSPQPILTGHSGDSRAPMGQIAANRLTGQ